MERESSMNDNTIDFVITWVDGSSLEWQKEKAKYDKNPLTLANSSLRYRDWDQLKYWFRGVEKYAPWVNKIYFVTIVTDFFPLSSYNVFKSKQTFIA